MEKRLIFSAFVALALGASSCRQHYEMAAIDRSRVLIDQRFDGQTDAEAAAFMAPYKQQVDSIMSPVVGRAAEYLWAHRPESNLSNLLSDILVWGGKKFGESPQVGVYNMGGIRAAFAEGPVTYGDVLDVAPFENKICFLNLTGTNLLKLFEQMAAVGGQGVSHGVALRISGDGRLLSAQLDGKDIDPTANYRVATLDFLAQGNDGLVAFKDKTDYVAPSGTENNVRFIIMDYFREQAAQGQAVDAKEEGRIVVE